MKCPGLSEPLADRRLFSIAVLACSRSGSARTRFGTFLFRDSSWASAPFTVATASSNEALRCFAPLPACRYAVDAIQWWHDSAARTCPGGRLRLDHPTELPEGTELDLVIDDEGDDLTEEERQALHETLSKSWTSAQAGKLRPAAEIIEELRRKG